MKNNIRRLLGAGLLWCASTAVVAEALPARSIYLSAADGTEVKIGTLHLTAADGRYSSRVVMDEQAYGDFFLSMRPFKCLSGEQQMLCHLPYPYENDDRIAPDDLTGLEYQLLFIRKAPNDYGINPWFGVYYQLQWQNPPHGPIHGQLFETNMDILAAPPEDPASRPITTDDLYEADASAHWLPTLRIR